MGIITLTIYCIFASISAVWVNHSFASENSSALTFITITFAQLFFIAISFCRKSNPLRFLMHNFRTVIILNLLTVMGWLFMFMALQKIEASVESAIYQGWIPIIILICGLINNARRKGKIDYLGPSCITFFLAALVVARLYSAGSIEREVVNGILLASVAGITGALYIYYSAKINVVDGCTIYEILSTRFFFLITLTGYLGHHSIGLLYQSHFDVIIKMILLSISFIIIPVYCLQHAIAKLGARRVSLIIPIVPAIALAVEYTYVSWSNILVPLFVIMVCISIIFSNLYRD